MAKIKNVLVTGDTHGRVMDRIANIGNYSPEDTALIILGDAGLNFYLNKTDKNNKRNVNNTGYSIYCVRGNHEERPENIPTMERIFDEDFRNYVYAESEYPNIKYFIDGEVYDILGQTVLVIGGAYSVDKWYRLQRTGVFNKLDPDYSNSKKTGWFPAEQLTAEEMARIQLDNTGLTFNVILTHTCPISWEPTDLFLSGLDQSSVDKSMELWLDEFKDYIDWQIWLFGHYHDDRLIRPGVEMFYKDIEDWVAIIERWKYPENLDWWLKKDPNYYMGV